MIFFGLLVGVYGYSLFLLGLLGVLSDDVVRYTFLFFLIPLGVLIPSIKKEFRSVFPLEIKKKFVEISFILLLACMALVNVLGALGPELAFDALWYHLTLPKLYLVKESIVFIPGGLLYYSAMPKFAELLYAGGLAFGGEVYPKVTHFFFGILTLVLIYKTSRLLISKKLSLFACVVFYANLVVAWESITAYVDLVWTFYSFGSIYLFLRYISEKNKFYLYLSGIFVGLAISTKLVAIGSFFLLLFALLYLKMKMKQSHPLTVKDFILVLFSISVIPLPWFLFSYIHTGNALYPFFSSLYPASLPLFSFTNVFNTLSVFFTSPDPISPMYVICFPLVYFLYKNFSQKEKFVLFLSVSAFFIWFLTPKSGGGRFILTFLPLFSVVVAIATERIKKRKLLYQLIVSVAIIVMVISIGYRGVANSRYFEVVIGEESKAKFLSSNLNFFYGDFYDIDNFFTEHLGADEKVLLLGFHNLYYVTFPFIDQSWVKKGDKFNYIAIQNGILPDRFSFMNKAYENKVTGISVYGEEGREWVY